MSQRETAPAREYLLVLLLLVLPFLFVFGRDGARLGVNVQRHPFAGPVDSLGVKVIALAADVFDVGVTGRFEPRLDLPGGQIRGYRGADRRQREASDDQLAEKVRHGFLLEV